MDRHSTGTSVDGDGERAERQATGRRNAPRRSGQSLGSPAARATAWVFVAATAWVLLCIPAILLSERGILPIDQSWFHSTQCLMCFVAFVAALAHLAETRTGRAPPAGESDPTWTDRRGIETMRTLALVVVIGTGLFLALVVAVVVFGAFVMSDFD